MGRIFHPLFALLASATRQELARQVAYLKEENRILWARLPERIVATPLEKKRLLLAGRRLGVQLKELMWTAKGLVDLYMLVFLHIGTRRCWISPCTASPNSQWVTQQAKNFLMDAEDLDLAPKMLMRDNDTKFTTQFDAVFENSDATIKRNTPLSPNLRAHVERFIQTLQVECLKKS